eukprot:GSMAST32.ASY1.ANO1.1104.1 assembled CDS
MQHDPVIWKLIGGQKGSGNFCSFKTKVAKDQDFCRNPYNVSGLCNKQSCPLANSRYATIREEKAVCYLYIKTIERAHSPKNLWEKIKLPKNYAKALAIIDENLQYWGKFMLHKNKQRLTKIHQYLIRQRKLALKRAACLDQTIQAELLDRLKSGTYGDIYNFNENVFSNTMDEAEISKMEEEESFGASEFVEGDFESDDEFTWDEDVDSNSEDEDTSSDKRKRSSSNKSGIFKKHKKSGKKNGKKSVVSSRPRVEVEYEYEEENVAETAENSADAW